MKDERIINIIKNGVMGGDSTYLDKTLKRVSYHNKDQAYAIIRKCSEHYGLKRSDIEDYHIDCALGDINGGVEVEWAS